MPNSKHLKKMIRQRMAETGEGYMVAMHRVLDEREGCKGCRVRPCSCLTRPDDIGNRKKIT